MCTETEPGQKSEFQQELRKVIFSHISDADKLDKESLDELIEYKTEELAEQLGVHRQQIARLNAELVRLEAKSTPDHAAQLDGQLKLKQKELEAHIANQPATVEKPNNLNAVEQQVYAGIAGEVENERTAFADLETTIAERQAKQKALTEQIALAKKLEGKLDNFEGEFTRLKRESAVDFKKLSLDVETLVTLSIDKAQLTGKRETFAAEKAKVDSALSETSRREPVQAEGCLQRAHQGASGTARCAQQTLSGISGSAQSMAAAKAGY